MERPRLQPTCCSTALAARRIDWSISGWSVESSRWPVRNSSEKRERWESAQSRIAAPTAADRFGRLLNRVDEGVDRPPGQRLLQSEPVAEPRVDHHRRDAGLLGEALEAEACRPVDTGQPLGHVEQRILRELASLTAVGGAGWGGRHDVLRLPQQVRLKASPPPTPRAGAARPARRLPSDILTTSRPRCHRRRPTLLP